MFLQLELSHVICHQALVVIRKILRKPLVFYVEINGDPQKLINMINVTFIHIR